MELVWSVCAKSLEVVERRRLVIARVWTKSLEHVENKGGKMAGDPTRCFGAKSLEGVENKGEGFGNVSRVRKVLKTRDEWIGAGSETGLGLTGCGMEEDCGTRKLGGGASMVYFTCWL